MSINGKPYRMGHSIMKKTSKKEKQKGSIFLWAGDAFVMIAWSDCKKETSRQMWTKKHHEKKWPNEFWTVDCICVVLLLSINMEAPFVWGCVF